jgi:Ni,Fe-hydrogenase III large subunit
VIESGHFRFHVVGERILHLDLRLFYKHRGLEQAAEGSDAAREGIRYAQRACAGCAVANSVAYAQAYESAAGLWPDGALADIRTVLLELERLWNHLNDISAICAGVGFAAGAMAFASLKERAQRLNERLAGHRFLFDSIAVARSPLSLERDDARTLREDLRELRADTARYWRELQFNSSVQARLTGVGTLTGEQALKLGTVGPAARAAGIRHDRRRHSPRLSYADFAVVAPSSAGDVAARLEQRVAELETTFDLFDTLLARPLRDGVAEPQGDLSSLGIGCVESPRGETVCVLELDGDRVGRLHLRTGSYANWPSVAAAATDNFLPDFPLINKSFELCYACSDR